MITIPTTEMVGCLSDVLPQITDPKGALAGVAIAWDGEALHFTTYDVYAGATIKWVPGEGAEGDLGDDEMHNDDIVWGGDDAPWETWIWLAQAKEVLKLFKLPAKLWRFPVSLKCTPVGDLIVERVDSPRGNRELRIPGDRAMLSKIPDVRQITYKVVDAPSEFRAGVDFAPVRIGAFGAIRPHGPLHFVFGSAGSPVAVRAGSRFAGFIYPQGAKPSAFNILRDGAGLVVTREPTDEAGQNA